MMNMAQRVTMDSGVRRKRATADSSSSGFALSKQDPSERKGESTHPFMPLSERGAHGGPSFEDASERSGGSTLS